MNGVTLKDVARAAGVSVATASRALSLPGRVHDTTRKRIETAAASLGYRPSKVARRLRVDGGPTHMLGVLIPDIQNPFFADVVRGIEDAAHAEGYSLLLRNVDEDVDRQRGALHSLHTESVDGVIVPPVREDDADVNAFAASGKPVVCVDRRVARDAFDTVVSNNEQGAYDAVAHLVRLGHQRIGLIGGLPGISTSRERRAGYERALREAGLAVDPALAREGDSRFESGKALTEALLGSPDRPTALFAANNLMTLGALAAVHAAGFAVPSDVAVVGYDDMPWALALNPPLTAVRQPGLEMGRRAADLLLQRISEPGRSPSLVVLQPTLVVRRSCGA
jgi:DNA-binding LacI/PurR family transcriptional regulator